LGVNQLCVRVVNLVGGGVQLLLDVPKGARIKILAVTRYV
jgi:hypothetical protein